MTSAAASLACLCDLNRLLILRLLLERPLAVLELTRATGLGQSLVSHHLAVLARGGWLEVRREGRRRVYAVIASRGRLAPLAEWVRREIPLSGGGDTPPEHLVAPGAGRDAAHGLEDYLL